LAAGLVLSSVLAAGGFFAYRAYWRLEQANGLLSEAWSLMRRGGLPEGDQAAGMIQKAIDLVPGHPPAQAALAELAARQGKSSFGAAVELARLSVAADPNCADCQAVLGYVLGTRAWRWEEARQALERALALDPKNLYARIWYAEWLAIHNRLDEALEHAKQVRALAPAELRGLSTVAFVHYFQGRFKDALSETEKANGMNRWFQPAHYWAYRSFMQMGDDYNAIMERGMEVEAWSGLNKAGVSAFQDTYNAILEKQGRAGVARAWIHEVRNGTPREVHRYNRAMWFAWIGEFDNALEELEAAVKSRPYMVIYTAVDPIFTPVRQHPRFQEVLRQVGLPASRMKP
jgi:tetratricopeptide (TPR) repeat protein